MQGHSFRRFEKVRRELSAAWGQVDVPFAQWLMAAHDGPRASMCHRLMADSDAATLSTGIFARASYDAFLSRPALSRRI